MVLFDNFYDNFSFIFLPFSSIFLSFFFHFLPFFPYFLTLLPSHPFQTSDGILQTLSDFIYIYQLIPLEHALFFASRGDISPSYRIISHLLIDSPDLSDRVRLFCSPVHVDDTTWLPLSDSLPNDDVSTAWISRQSAYYGQYPEYFDYEAYLRVRDAGDVAGDVAGGVAGNVAGNVAGKEERESGLVEIVMNGDVIRARKVCGKVFILGDYI